MILEEPPKLLQPRDHKAKVSIWNDLTVNDLDVISEVVEAEDLKVELAKIFALEDYKEDLKTGILLDLYFYTIQFARDNKFTKEQTSALFSIVKKTHDVCTETPFGNVQHCFRYFREMLLCHAVKRPPFSIDLFSPEEVRKVSDYVMNTYFRHYRLYKYAFTTLVRLDISMNYPDIPAEPEPEEELEAEKAEEKEESGEKVEETEAKQRGEGDKEQTEKEPESAAASELRMLVRQHLEDEIKKLKVNIDDQLKSSEEKINKKLAVVEDVKPDKRKSSGKGKKK